MGLILVVEDEQGVRDLLKILLGEEHLVIEATTGEDALRLVQKVRPNLVILDVNLEGSKVSGLGVCKSLGTTPALAGMPVLVISGWAERDDISEMFSQCATFFLRKPYTNAELKETVNRLLLLELRGLDRLSVASEDDIIAAVQRAIRDGNSLKVMRALEEGLKRGREEIESRLGDDG